MIFDAQALFSDGQAITATAASTNTIDLGARGTPYGSSTALVRDPGKGCEVPISVTVTEAFATLTSLTISVEVDDNSSFSSAATIFTTTAIPVASLTLGYVLKQLVEIPEGTNEQYMRLKYTVAGSNATTGKILAGIVASRQSNYTPGR